MQTLPATLTPTFSVITPTYNRGSLLNAAYQSLLRQSSKDFVWIIIDDGSTDNTQTLCQAWIEEQKIKIIYEHQENGGVNRARNRGIELAQGELCLFLDSDDYLSDDAISTIYHHYETIKDNPKIGGLLFLCGYQKSNEIIGIPFREEVSINNYIRLCYWDKIDGDKVVVHKIDLQKKYPFPAFEGEKFALEATMFFRMAKEVDYLCVNIVLKYVEYLDDGQINNRTPESEMIQGLLAYHEQRMDRAFPYRIRSKSSREWLRLKLKDTPLLSALRESKCFYLSLLGIPRMLLKMLRMRVRKTKS